MYTQSTCLYPLLNSILRDHAHSSEAAKAFLPYLKLLLTGLNKLPLTRVTAYRGIKADVHEVYNDLDGKVITWWALSSTTLRKRTSEVFLHGTEGTLFTIDAIGVDIAAFSDFPDEQEVLLLPGTCLMVTNGVMVDRDYWAFEVSVWEAAHQRLEQRQKRKEKSKVANSADVTPSAVSPEQDDVDPEQKDVDPEQDDVKPEQNDRGAPLFQNTDLPHPGWNEIMLSDKSSRSPNSSPGYAPISLNSAPHSPDFSPSLSSLSPYV